MDILDFLLIMLGVFVLAIASALIVHYHKVAKGQKFTDPRRDNVYESDRKKQKS